MSISLNTKDRWRYDFLPIKVMGNRLWVMGSVVQGSGVQSYAITFSGEPSYLLSRVWNSESRWRRDLKTIERPTSNIEHRTSNMDGAALYLFLYQGITLKMWFIDSSLRRTTFGLSSCRRQPSQILIRTISSGRFPCVVCGLLLNWQNTLFDVGRSMFDVRCSFLS